MADPAQLRVRVGVLLGTEANFDAAWLRGLRTCRRILCLYTAPTDLRTDAIAAFGPPLPDANQLPVSQQTACLVPLRKKRTGNRSTFARL